MVKNTAYWPHCFRSHKNTGHKIFHLIWNKHKSVTLVASSDLTKRQIWTNTKEKMLKAKWTCEGLSEQWKYAVTHRQWMNEPLMVNQFMVQLGKWQCLLQDKKNNSYSFCDTFNWKINHFTHTQKNPLVTPLLQKTTLLWWGTEMTSSNTNTPQKTATIAVLSS